MLRKKLAITVLAFLPLLFWGLIHFSSFEIFGLGLLFGWLLSLSGINQYDIVVGMATGKNMLLAKTVLATMGISTLLVYDVYMNHNAIDFSVQPLYLTTLIPGALLFGSGWAILGYSPSAIPVSIGQGAADAFWGLVGGIFAVGFVSIYFPMMRDWLMVHGSTQTVYSMVHKFTQPELLVITIGIAVSLLYTSYLLDRVDYLRGYPPNYWWVVTAVGVSLIAVYCLSSFGLHRPLGSYAAVAYVTDTLSGLRWTSFYDEVGERGKWECLFFSGALVGGLSHAYWCNTLQRKLIYEEWEYWRDEDAKERRAWSFIGGFMLFLGACLAGGGSLEHLVTGAMQMSVTSYVFALLVFASFMFTGHFFYIRKRRS